LICSELKEIKKFKMYKDNKVLRQFSGNLLGGWNETVKRLTMDIEPEYICPHCYAEKNTFEGLCPDCKMFPPLELVKEYINFKKTLEGFKNLLIIKQ
jgi:hypothetical protein